jgi:hypothetical protein
VGGGRSSSFVALLSFGRPSSFVGGRIRFWAVVVSFVFVVVSRAVLVSGQSSFLGGCPRLWSVGVDVVAAQVLVVGIVFCLWLWRREVWWWWLCWLKKISHVTHGDMCIMYKHAREITFR